MLYFFFFFKQKTAYEIYQCDWSSDVCSSDLITSLTDERKKVSEEITIAFRNLKDEGFDPKIVREVIRLLAMDKETLAEREAKLDSYKDAVGL